MKSRKKIKEKYLEGSKESRERFVMNSSEDEIRNIIGHRIRAFRISRGLTQESLANRSGLNATYIGRIESGTRLLSLDVLRRIADTLKVEGYELLISEDKAKTSDYKKKQLIRIIKKSNPKQIDLYFDLVRALDKKNLKDK